MRSLLVMSSRRLPTLPDDGYDKHMFLQPQGVVTTTSNVYVVDAGDTVSQGQMLASFPPPELTPTIRSTTLLPLMIPVVAMRNLRPADPKHD